MTEKNVKCHHEEAFCKVQTLENYKISKPITVINKLKEGKKKKKGEESGKPGRPIAFLTTW